MAFEETVLHTTAVHHTGKGGVSLLIQIAAMGGKITVFCPGVDQPLAAAHQPKD